GPRRHRQCHGQRTALAWHRLRLQESARRCRRQRQCERRDFVAGLAVKNFRPREAKCSGGGGPREVWRRGHAARLVAASPTPLTPQPMLRIGVLELRERRPEAAYAPFPASRGRKRKRQGRSPMPDPEWSLHPQLAADTMLVGDLALSRLLAIN